MDNDNLEQKLFQLESRVNIVEDGHKRNDEQHKEFYAKFEKLTIDSITNGINYNTIISLITNLQSETKSMKDEISSQKEKPAKRWENVVTTVITTVVTAIVTYFLVKGGLK